MISLISILLLVHFVVFGMCLLCFILGKFNYELHISVKKIEILPAKESPKQNTNKKRA